MSVVRVPLSELAQAVAVPRSERRVRELSRLYAASRPLAPIPVRWSHRRGWLALDRDGNHRLAAARLAGVGSVLVRIDTRDAHRVRQC